VANPLETISDEEIEAILLLADGSERTPPSAPLMKPAFANWLLDVLDEMRQAAD
jgi:hypothetical protein